MFQLLEGSVVPTADEPSWKAAVLQPSLASTYTVIKSLVTASNFKYSFFTKSKRL